MSLPPPQSPSTGPTLPSWPTRPAGLLYGGDYNPEQWPEDIWPEDVRLMRAAGVNLVTVGVFSWALLEPAEGRFEFSWLDRVLDLLHGGGIAVDLATATASPPPWFSRRYPESLPVTRDGTRLWPGGRQAFCPSSAVYRAAATRLAGALAERYADHPALAMWHVHNEYGCHNAHCHCDASAAAFRAWLRDRYGTVDRLNAAWGTAFWSQRYTDWDEIQPARAVAAIPNPTQDLDFRRFSSDELLACFRAEAAVLRRATPRVPVTTNFMATLRDDCDYWAWAREVDLVSTDHYLAAEDPENQVGLALAADVTRGLAGGAPWLLMEHSTSAVNWQPRNVAKRPGELRRNSLAHVARGADGVCFFQWRQSLRGAEKFHSAMLPHAGTDTRVWREVTALGADLDRLAPVRGSRVAAQVAIAWDWQSWWALELDARPTVDLRYLAQVKAVHRALWRAGITADVVHLDAPAAPSAAGAPEAPGRAPEGSGDAPEAPGAAGGPGAGAGPLARYQLVLVPSLYLTTDAAAERLAAYVRGGGTAAVWCGSGLVDADDAIRPGGYPGAFRDLLGVRVEELRPLPAGATVRLSDGSTASVWTEDLRVTTAEPVTTHADAPLAGVPAVTRNRFGDGTAWYVATCLDDGALARLVVEEVAAGAGVRPPLAVPAGVEVVRRVGADGGAFVFVLNHTEDAVTVPAGGLDLLTGTRQAAPARIPAGGAVVLATDSATGGVG